jgi:hypothetical protein
MRIRFITSKINKRQLSKYTIVAGSAGSEQFKFITSSFLRGFLPF